MTERKKPIRWVRRPVPICPYDQAQLRAESDPGFPYYGCPCCKRRWPIETRKRGNR